MTESIILSYMLLFLIAVLYSSVGHGGASGYLALMTFYHMSPDRIKPVALVLNIMVSSIAFVQFYRSGYFDKKIFLPLALVSVPAAFVGGLISIHPILYKQILGVLLFITAIRFFIPMKIEEETSIKHKSVFLLFLIGGCIGFISGLIGIGGGILLSPVLVLLHYSNIKTTSGISALFIVVNSIAGLLGQMKQGILFSTSMYAMILFAVAGGILGSYLGTKRFNSITLRKVLALVLVVASLKLIFV